MNYRNLRAQCNVMRKLRIINILKVHIPNSYSPTHNNRQLRSKKFIEKNFLPLQLALDIIKISHLQYKRWASYRMITYLFVTFIVTRNCKQCFMRL